jgi:hypothetical protein
MEFAVRGGLKMDRIRLIAALTNGVLVLTLYTVAWGTPALDIAMLELSLAVGCTPRDPSIPRLSRAPRVARGAGL